jgi:hypothetical protein
MGWEMRGLIELNIRVDLVPFGCAGTGTYPRLTRLDSDCYRVNVAIPLLYTKTCLTDFSRRSISRCLMIVVARDPAVKSLPAGSK